MSNDNITINVAQYNWSDDTNMNTGVIAQEITSIDLSPEMSVDTITIAGFNGTSTSSFGAIPPTNGAIAGAGYTISGSGATGSFVNLSVSDPYAELCERLEKLEKIISEEAEIRKQCEAVNNAYNEYRLLLILAKKNKGDLLTED